MKTYSDNTISTATVEGMVAQAAAQARAESQAVISAIDEKQTAEIKMLRKHNNVLTGIVIINFLITVVDVVLSRA